MMRERSEFEETLANTCAHLLALRTTDGHWTGALSSSALSTATALFALTLYFRESSPGGDPHVSRRHERIDGAIRWLTRTQNSDGGWGDTTASPSNLSTTALCWSALTVASSNPSGLAQTLRRTEQWLIRCVGTLEPAELAKAIGSLYGRDRTFSVPILTMCALAGRLGEGRAAWRAIPRLPFELAVCPHRWFQWLQLPVVSYALPALIAIGQVGHHFHPTPDPFLRIVRRIARPKTLRKLEALLPEGGGFLEAVPLTSFVLMSLIGCGETAHPVVVAGIDFLERSARTDGSWPIDTNLATWLTTLSVNALGSGGRLDSWITRAGQESLTGWLLNQQHRIEHPYTHAAPGGWAWTDLSGGVPDADDTAGALLALRHLAPHDARTRDAAGAGVKWLLDLQNRDGGVPTFCRGWGALPFDRSGADLTAHALLAWGAWLGLLDRELAARTREAIQKGHDYLARTQRADGAWIPLWFGNHSTPDNENPTYGTARVLMAILTLEEDGFVQPTVSRQRAVTWLLRAQNPDGGWGGDCGVPGSIEETGLAVQALARAARGVASTQPDLLPAVLRGIAWLARQTDCGRRFVSSPIGLYFARLWYFEQLYPLLFCAGALVQTARLLEERASL